MLFKFCVESWLVKFLLVIDVRLVCFLVSIGVNLEFLWGLGDLVESFDLKGFFWIGIKSFKLGCDEWFVSFLGLLGGCSLLEMYECNSKDCFCCIKILFWWDLFFCMSFLDVEDLVLILFIFFFGVLVVFEWDFEVNVFKIWFNDNFDFFFEGDSVVDFFFIVLLFIDLF